MFRDRKDAGEHLVGRLRQRHLKRPVVLAVPRGGVVVGESLAEGIGAELDIVLARKLRAPYQRELAIGAVAEDGDVHIDEFAHRVPGVTEAYLAEEAERELAELDRSRRLFRAARPRAAVKGRSVVVTDDGVATGSTLLAALRIVRAQEPHELLVAVPVAPAAFMDRLENKCDQAIILHLPTSFQAVGQFYAAFDPVTDEEVMEILRRAANRDRNADVAESVG